MPHPQTFNFDVSLSHSKKDKPTVQSLANRLRADGLNPRPNNNQIKPGDNIPAKTPEPRASATGPNNHKQNPTAPLPNHPQTTTTNSPHLLPIPPATPVD